MSIINEALKKAGREVTATQSQNQSARIPLLSPLEAAPKRSSMNWGPVFVLLVLLLITGPIIAPIFSTPLRHTQTLAPLPPAETQVLVGDRTDLASAPSSAVSRKAQFGIEEAPRLAGVAHGFVQRPPFDLSGIVYSKNESYTLINGRVVKVGELVEGARLVEVTPTKAILEFEGQRIELASSQT